MALGLHFFQLSQEGFAGARLFDDTFALRTLRGVPKVLTRAGLHGNIQDSFGLMDALSPNTGTIGFEWLEFPPRYYWHLGGGGIYCITRRGHSEESPGLLHQALSEHGTGLFPVVFPVQADDLRRKASALASHLHPLLIEETSLA